MAQEQHYNTLIRPIITEKSTLMAEDNKVLFEVPVTATKPQIKAAVEALFKVKVDAVNTLRQKGKVKRFRGQMGRRKDIKKAMVTIAQGDSVDVTTGL